MALIAVSLHVCFSGSTSCRKLFWPSSGFIYTLSLLTPPPSAFSTIVVSVCAFFFLFLSLSLSLLFLLLLLLLLLLP